MVGDKMNNNEMIMGFLSEKRKEVESKKKSNSKVSKLTENKKSKRVTESINIAELLPDYDAEYTENASLMDINNIVDTLKEAGFNLADWFYSDEDGEGWEFVRDTDIVDVYLDGDILKIFVSEIEDDSVTEKRLVKEAKTTSVVVTPGKEASAINNKVLDKFDYYDVVLQSNGKAPEFYGYDLRFNGNNVIITGSIDKKGITDCKITLPLSDFGKMYKLVFRTIDDDMRSSLKNLGWNVR